MLNNRYYLSPINWQSGNSKLMLGDFTYVRSHSMFNISFKIIKTTLIKNTSVGLYSAREIVQQ